MTNPESGLEAIRRALIDMPPAVRQPYETAVKLHDALSVMGEPRQDAIWASIQTAALTRIATHIQDVADQIHSQAAILADILELAKRTADDDAPEE